MKSLAGKKALITGASRGIGQQIAIGLARVGCDVILHARSIENLAQTEALLQDYAITIDKIGCELSRPNELDAMLTLLDQKYAHIDIVYNNAAISCGPQPLFQLNRSLWDEIFEVNVFALIKICEHFLPKMLDNNFGRIINFTSGIADQPQMAPYAASKAVVSKYTQDMAIKLKNTNVLMNLIQPGWVKTDMGGEDADSTVESVLPGVLVPALLDEGSECGKIFCVWDFKDLKLP